jgi:hypothetical protein
LSYLSKALSFLRQNLPAFRTPEMRERIIGYRAESALLFESRGKLREAYFEYQFLAGLLLEKAKTDPSAFLPAIVAALKAAEICEKAKIDLRFIPHLYRQAAAACRRLAAVAGDEYQVYYREQAREFELMVLEVRDRIDAARLT